MTHRIPKKVTGTRGNIGSRFTPTKGLQLKNLVTKNSVQVGKSQKRFFSKNPTKEKIVTQARSTSWFASTVEVKRDPGGRFSKIAADKGLFSSEQRQKERFQNLVTLIAHERSILKDYDNIDFSQTSIEKNVTDNLNILLGIIRKDHGDNTSIGEKISYKEMEILNEMLQEAQETPHNTAIKESNTYPSMATLLETAKIKQVEKGEQEKFNTFKEKLSTFSSVTIGGKSFLPAYQNVLKQGDEAFFKDIKDRLLKTRPEDTLKTEETTYPEKNGFLSEIHRKISTDERWNKTYNLETPEDNVVIFFVKNWVPPPQDKEE